MRVLGVSSEDEMVACFLGAELTSERFGEGIRSHLVAAGQTERLLTHPDLSDGSRLAADAAVRVEAGVRVFDVPNDRFVTAAHALVGGARFPPLILVGEGPDALVCLEGNLRLTAYALAGFPTDVECLVGTAPTMGR